MSGINTTGQIVSAEYGTMVATRDEDPGAHTIYGSGTLCFQNVKAVAGDN